MVITRNQSNAMEAQETTIRVLDESPLSLDEQGMEGVSRPQDAPLASATRTITTRTGRVSPSRSQRSTMSATMRSRLAELEAEEKLANIRREQLSIEAELIRRRLAVKLTSIRNEAEDEREQLNEESEERIHRVDDWLRSQSDVARGEQAPCKRIDVPQSERRPERRARSPSPSQSSDIKQLAAVLEKMTRTQPTPRQAIDLPTFAGAINEWLPFKAAMRDSTQLYRLTPVENIARLRNSLRGDARDAVSALLHTAANPYDIMRTLEQCFGRPEVIIDKAFEDMRRLPRPGTTASELNTFAVKLQNIVCILQNLDKRNYLHNPMLAREVLEKLSPHLKARWCDYAEENDGTTDPEIVVLSQFLMREASRAIKHTYAAAYTTAPSRRDIKPAAPQFVTKKKQSVFTTTDTETERQCPCCEKSHSLSRCLQYKALNVEQRWDLVKSKSVCFKCIDKHHRRANCKEKPCGVDCCRRPHHASLHLNEPSDIKTSDTNETVMAVAASSKLTEIMLKVCPVTVSGPKGAVDTYALLDEGSTVSLIDEDLANTIGAHGPIYPLQINGVNMRREYTQSQLIQLKLCERDSDNAYDLRARTINGLRLRKQTIPKSILKHAHLRNLAVKQVCYEKARPRILIGTDHWEMIVSRKLRVGKANQPAASKTQLGWVVHGTIPHTINQSNDYLLHVYIPGRGDTNVAQVFHKLVESHFRINALGGARLMRSDNTDNHVKQISGGTIQRCDHVPAELHTRSIELYIKLGNYEQEKVRRLHLDTETFVEWLYQLENVTRQRLSRSYNLIMMKQIELHILCDASEQAYATAAYWCVTYNDSRVHVVLKAAKAKVAPRRTQTIPRLELQAAVIRARLSAAIRREHRLEIARTVYWTDSTTVVHWIRNDKRRYTPYVAHRLGEISELTEKGQWRWLPTQLNVANDATRSAKTAINSNDRWFTGPCFLSRAECEWPTEHTAPQEDVEEIVVTYAIESNNAVLPDAARFSSYERLVRTVATMLAFADICRRKAKRVEKRHIDRAENVVLRQTQTESFADDIERLTRGKVIPRTSRLYKLNPEINQDDMLRMRGRIGAANVSSSVKQPLILDGKHTTVQKLIAEQHSDEGRCNRERVINDLRQRYWILKLRPAVRTVERESARCKIRRTTPRTPITGDLPAVRLDAFHRPFTNCGVDYFGPLQVTIGRRREKRWVALFTCLTTRAIHLEIAASLSTDSAIMALRRMAAKIGWPAIMYSDNATKFRGAENELRTAYDEWTPILREEGLRRRYVPLYTPNHGGAWECLAGSVKKAADRRRPLSVGDLVVVVDASLPRNTWPRGLIVRTYTGPDGGVRSADVQTRSSVFRRPISKLAVLEIEATQATPGGELLRTASHVQDN